MQSWIKWSVTEAWWRCNVSRWPPLRRNIDFRVRTSHTIANSQAAKLHNEPCASFQSPVRCILPEGGSCPASTGQTSSRCSITTSNRHSHHPGNLVNRRYFSFGRMEGKSSSTEYFRWRQIGCLPPPSQRPICLKPRRQHKHINEMLRPALCDKRRHACNDLSPTFVGYNRRKKPGVPSGSDVTA